MSNTKSLQELLQQADIRCLVSNSEVEWARKGEELVKAGTGTAVIVVNLTIKAASLKSDRESAKENPSRELYECTRVPTDDVLDLQYFFPYCDQFLKTDGNNSVLLVICGKNSDIQRASCYLMAQAACHNRLFMYSFETETLVTLDDECVLSNLLYSEKSIGSLFPLLRVGKSLAAPDGSIAARGLSLEALMSPSSFFLNCISNPDMQQPLPNDDPQLQLLLTVGRNQILGIINNLKGISGQNITNSMRPLLLNELWEYVKQDINRLPLLTQFIWLYSLCYLSRQKEIITAENGGKLHRERIDLALWDAVAYGEGILQLLENSEQHSRHRAGYFTVVFQDISLRRSASLVENASKRERIYRRYRAYVSEPAFLPLEADYYLEFSVTDMSYDDDWEPHGISKCAGQPLSELFSGAFKDTDASDAEKIIHHYGMPLFSKTVRLNKGRFVCITPDVSGKVSCFFAHKDTPETSSAESGQAWSTYRILLPVTYQAPPHVEQLQKTIPSPLFDSKLLGEKPTEFQQVYLHRDGKLINSGDASKQENVHKVGEWLLAQITECRTVYLVDLRRLSSIEFEVYVKGLFYFFYLRKDTSDSYILMRVIFRDKFSLCEFLRRAAIFYGKMGQNSWMEHVQMALCVATVDEASASPEQAACQARDSRIWLLLAGKDLSTAYATAKLFAHYSLEDSTTILPQIQYLTRVQPKVASDDKVPTQPQFPFDLVRRDDKESQFLERMLFYLNQNLQGEWLGCKIENAHVRLGSKIHIADFYEAELLFHSVGHIYRFAYLIAEDLLGVLKAAPSRFPKHLILVGYEGYSSILVEQVMQILLEQNEQDRPGTILHMQYLRKDDGVEYITPASTALSDVSAENAACVFIMPVGTTLSTIYKIRNVFSRQYSAQLNGVPPVLRGYSVIVVGDSSNKRLSDRYWKKNTKSGLIALSTEKNKDPKEQDITVRYFLMPETRWYMPTACEFCGHGDEGENPLWARPTTHIPLTQVDKTSTLPSLIFPLKKGGIKGISSLISSPKQNDSRLENLRGNIQYGHITLSPNHFQFYIDYTAYYAKERDNCKKWLKELRGSVDTNAFNIIVSPSTDNDCLFVKDTLDIVFQHSLRLLFLPLESVFREDIRAKFSYITQEYLAACSGDFQPQINVYYVDYTLVSGHMLQRGKSLVNMLLQGISRQDAKTVRLFRKVILLLNRSSYDTIAAVVQEPEQNFRAYATLAVSTFNTNQGHCPTCELTELYEEVSKCSATNELYWHFKRLAKKHQLRTPEEHDEWLEGVYVNRINYLQFLCQHLYNDKGSGSEIDELEVKVDKWRKAHGITDLCNEDAQKIISHLSLGQLLPKPEDRLKSPCLEMLRREITPKRYWRRIICTHKAMCLQERIAMEGWGTVQVGAELWELIQTEVLSMSDQFLQREWLISYLKVFSRGYLAKLAPIRKSIYTLLELILLTMTASPNPKDNIDEPLEKEWEIFLPNAKKDKLAAFIGMLRIRAELRAHELLQIYQLYLTVAKRLCNLQSNLLLQYDMLLRIEDFLNSLRKCREDILKTTPIIKKGEEDPSLNAVTALLALPTEDKMRIHYVRLVKWAIMSSAEESKAFPLQLLANRLIERSDGAGILDCGKLGNVLRIENTRILYTGIKRLDELCMPDLDWESIKAQVAEQHRACKNNDASKESEEPYFAQNPLSDLFRFLEINGSADDESLAAMLALYRAVKGMEAGAVLEAQKNYIEQYSRLCFFMKKIAHCQNCCLAHRQNDQNQIIAQSLSTEDTGTIDLVNSILSDCQEELMESRLYNTAVAWNGGGKGTGCVLSLQIQRRQDIARQQNVYIVLFNPEAEKPHESYDRNILFLRQPLQRLLERDLYALHHFRFSYQDVTSLSKETEKVTILHLTDLHITADNENDILVLINDRKAELTEGTPDLLIITGDIVQGNSAATDLENNYKAAGRVIRKLAEVLWPSVEPGPNASSPRFDWKKRVILIPGNHDYASMNELSATHFLRSTNGGIPVLKDGSPMQKFSYYIQFLRECLDIDISQSVHNDLNETREYPELGIRLVALNSVAEVGPMRNNKVQLDENYIERQVKTSTSRKYATIYLSHHTVCYKPDYVFDQYYEKGLSSETVALAKEIVRECEKAQTELIAHPDQAETIRNDMSAKLNEFHRRSSYKELDKHKKFTLYSDVEYVEQHWDKDTNERCQQIFSDFNRHEMMAETDRKAFLGRFRTLAQKIPPHIMLGGHTHEAGRGDCRCIQGPRFYNNNDPTKLRFGRLSVHHTGEIKLEYQFVPRDMPVVPLSLPLEVADAFLT